MKVLTQPIQLGFAIDKNFGKFAGITITSLVHNNPHHQLSVHIVYDQLLPADREKLQQTASLYRNLTLHFYQITSTDGMTFIVPPGHITQAMYYRYLFAELLPLTVKRLIYLDADIICKGDIMPLWQTDLQGRVLGAVRDWGEAKSCERIGLASGRYFNSGVLLLDLEQWRQQQLTPRLFRWLQGAGAGKILWGDQDALNGVLDGSFTELPKKYNCIVLSNTRMQAQADDVLIHYVDCVKPWHIYCMDSAAKRLYWQYVAKSLWDDLEPVDGNTVEKVLLTARVLYQEGCYEKSISYYEALMKYFLKDKYT